MNFIEALKVSEGVFSQYKTEQLKWWKKMDGTPILNDISVKMATAFSTEEQAQVSQEPVAESYLVNVGGSGEHMAINWQVKPFETLLFTSPPDYEALKAALTRCRNFADQQNHAVNKYHAENEALKTRVAEYKASSEQDAKTMTKLHHDKERLRGVLFEVETERDNALLETDKLQARVAELEYLEHNVIVMTGISERVAAERDKLQSECDQLRNRPFECWSKDDGDSWCEHPADSEFVGGLKVGDTFELLAGYDSVRVKYVVTKAPDDVDDEYEVEQSK